MRFGRLALAVAAIVVAVPGPAQAATVTSYTGWNAATSIAPGTKTLRTTYNHRRYEYVRWTSPWTTPGYPIGSVVPSWNASTPGSSFITVEIRLRTPATRGSWDTVATWAFGRTAVRSTSHTSQRDDIARMAVDTALPNAVLASSYQLRVTLYRRAGSTDAVTLRSAGAVAASFRSRTAPTSSTTVAQDVELAVPRLSQMTHTGHYPSYGGGGEAWCSPTSVAMVLRFFGIGPTLFGAIKGADKVVDHAALHSYDVRYDGTGNWGFAVAYAGRYAPAFVTRLNDLRDAEQFIEAGIPLVVSIRFGRGQLAGSPLRATGGHLLVITGFTGAGQVIANDPAASINKSVRRVYSRSEFEAAWLRTGAITYVIDPPGVPLPAANERWQ